MTMAVRIWARVSARWLTVLVSVGLTGCGALWDAAYPPPPDPRVVVGFYIAKTEAQPGWIKQSIVDTDSVLYLSQEPIVSGTEIRSATPMLDPAGYFFVAIRLNDSGTRKLAQASGRALGDRLALVINDRLLGSALIDAPIEKGLFAMATRDKSSAMTLSQALGGSQRGATN